nr:helix-turn-helix domain-containing protein [Pseudomonas aeruginosa]
MVKRTSHKQASCPVARPLDVIGDGWSMLIVRDAFEGLTRFGEFQKSLGLAKNILAARLRNLVEHGVMVAVPAESGSHQEYRLTDKGRALFPLLVAIRQWGEDYFFAPDESHIRLVERDSGQPVPRLQVRDPRHTRKPALCMARAQRTSKDFSASRRSPWNTINRHSPFTTSCGSVNS